MVELQQNLHAMVELLKNALHLHTCALFFLKADGERLKVAAYATGSPRFSEAPLPIDAGIIGTVVKSQHLVNLAQPNPQSTPPTIFPSDDFHSISSVLPSARLLIAGLNRRSVSTTRDFRFDFEVW